MIRSIPYRHVYSHEFVFTRRDGLKLTTLATLTLGTFRKNLDRYALLKIFRGVLSKWLRETPEGQRAWKDSCHTFNIGDYALLEDTIKRWCFERFRKRGIVAVDLDLVPVVEEYDYDWVLRVLR